MRIEPDIILNGCVQLSRIKGTTAWCRKCCVELSLALVLIQAGGQEPDHAPAKESAQDCRLLCRSSHSHSGAQPSETAATAKSPSITLNGV